MATKVTKRLLIVNSASSMIARLLDVSVFIWLNQYLLTRLQPHEFAIYPVIASVVALSPLLHNSVTPGIARFAVEAYAKGDNRRVTQIVSTMLPFLCFLGALILALGFGFSYFVDRILTIDSQMAHDAQWMAAIMAFGVAIKVVTKPFCMGPYVRQNFVVLNLLGVANSILRISLLLTLLLGVSARVIWIPVSSVTATFFTVLASMVVTRFMVPAARFSLQEMRWDVAKSILSFGVWSHIGAVSGQLYRNVDAIILNKLATAVDVNAYHLGAMPHNQIRSAVRTGSSPLMPAMTTLYAQGQRKRFGNAFLRGNRYAMWVALCVGVPFIVFRRELVQLYVGDRYADAATVIALLLLAHPFNYSNHMLSKIASATAQLRPYQLRSIAMQLCNVALTIFFVWKLKMGAVGPALGTLIACSLGQPLLLYRLGWRMAEVSPSRWLRETFLPGITPAVACFASLFALQSLSSPTSWLAVFAYSALGFFVYVSVLYTFCLSADEKSDVLKTLLNAKLKLFPKSKPVYET